MTAYETVNLMLAQASLFIGIISLGFSAYAVFISKKK